VDVICNTTARVFCSMAYGMTLSGADR
jgi:hypothetical protein